MSQEELEKLLLEAHISQDFDLKTLESQWFQTFCKVRKNGCPFLIFGCVSLILFGHFSGYYTKFHSSFPKKTGANGDGEF